MNPHPPLIKCFEHNRMYYSGSDCPECVCANIDAAKLISQPTKRECEELARLRNFVNKHGPVPIDALFENEHATDYTQRISDVDPVNHPPHYKAHPSGIECIEITRHMTFNLGNAVKYIWRSDHKHATVQDLKKAIWYIEDEIKRIKNEH